MGRPCLRLPAASVMLAPLLATVAVAITTAGSPQQAAEIASGQRSVEGGGFTDDQPATSPRSGSEPFVFSVTDFGAKGDNRTECTSAFQAAIDAASTAQGGEVYVPPGMFILAGNLTVPPGVTLRGSYGSVPSHQLGIGNGQSLHDGSVLVPTGGRGTTGCAASVDDLNCTVTFITLATNAAVKNLVVYYAEQETQLTPVPYPWSFRLAGNNAALIDVEMLGCWNCIAAVYSARHYIARVCTIIQHTE